MYFGYNYSIEYATDTYPTFQELGTWKEKIYINGRIVAGFVYYLIERLGITGGIIYHISQLSSIILLTCSVALLAHIYKKHIENLEISVLLAFIALVNPFIIEYFLFVEKGLLIFAILLNVIALYFTEKIWHSGFGIMPAILTLISLLLAVFTYQTSIQSYVVLALPLIVISKTDFFKKNVFVATMYVVCMGLAFASVKWIFVSDRLGESEEAARPTFVEGLETIRRVTFDSFFHMGKGVFSIWCIVLVLISVICVVCAINKLQTALAFLYIIIGCIFTSFILHFIVAEIGCSPRTVYSYGILFGTTLFYAFTVEKEDGWLALGKAAGVLSLCLILTIISYDYIAFGKVFINRYKCNQENLYYAEIIGEQIEEYEQLTGEVIDTICFYVDYNITWWGDGYSEDNFSTRAQSCGWSRLTSINLYLEKEYIEGEADPEYEEYFATRNWNTYSQEQLIFDGNILHLCVY